MICLVCRNLLVAASRDLYQITPHHLTYASLASSVENGCYICNELWATLTTEEQILLATLHQSESRVSNADMQVSTGEAYSESIRNSITEAQFSRLGRGCYELMIYCPADALVASWKGRGSHYSRATFVLQSRNSPSNINITTYLGPNTKSAETLDRAKRWIADCTASHQLCNADGGSSKHHYPTRIIDCGLLEDSKIVCRLVETKTTFPTGPYITLSHCWGLADCLKLTTLNYPQLLSGVPLSLFPQLYQDAVHITRSLNIRYLRIDSLCIIQQGDDLADWQHEVAIMGDVYSNSLCTISAADAPDSHHSMFSSRHPDALHPEIVSLSIDNHIAPYLISNSSFWENEVHFAIINTRAWVLQERFLSPRVLYFGARQIFWECREKDASEIYPDGLPTYISQYTTKFKSLNPDKYSRSEQMESDVARYGIWFNIVRAYTKCRLTFPSDKLAALSAVAKMMKTFLCDEYVAGMWRRYLERELLWSLCDSPSADAPQLDTYRAPSWSWIAVNGGVLPGSSKVLASDVLIKVESLQLEYLTDDNTVLISGGWLRLRGVLKKLMLVPNRPPTTAPYFANWQMTVNGVQVSAPSVHDKAWFEPHILLDAYHEDFDKQNAESTLYCMLGKREDLGCYVLLLELVDRERATFRRIGLARSYRWDMAEKFLAQSGEEVEFPCLEYRDGLHSICII